MILIDTNLLVYAYAMQMPQHERANRWLDEQLQNGMRVGMPWHSLLGFVRIVSNPKAFTRPDSVAAAWQQVRLWLGAGNVWTPLPTERHVGILDGIVSAVSVTSDFVMDMHLAALALEHGLTLYSNDRDFARVPKLRWVNPLE